ncbi:MAG: hypothetical protein M0R02_12200 [Bacteroidales bacterium]|nr:hypothetical protein [Bacteroidales bacterium]
MALRKRPLATGVAALLFSSWVSAVGLGEIQLHSALNEPLDAEIRLHNLGDLTESEILAGLASASEFTRAGLDREAILSELSFSLDLSNPAAPLLRVNSKRAIREPYLDFLVDVRWPSGRLLREYTLLLDLPVYAADRPVSARAVETPQSLRGEEQRPAPATPASRRAAPAGRDLAPLAGGDEYRVGTGETLWSIASRLSGGGSVHARLAAIHQLNPGAFIDGNINLLREGAILRLPDGSQMAATQAPPAPAPASGAAGSDVAPVRFAAASPDGGDEPGQVPVGRLSLSAIDPDTVNADTVNESVLLAQAPGESGGAGGGLIRDRLQDIQDELARTQRENHELRSRLGSLEDQLATMQRLIEVGSDEMRALQLVAGSNGMLDEERGVDHTVAQEGASQADGPAEPGSGPGDDALAASQSPAAPAAAPAQPQAAQLQTTNKGWFETVSSYLVYILGGLAALIVALVVVVLRKRRHDSDDDGFAVPPPAVERQRVAPAQPASPAGAGGAPVWSPVSSVDDITLDEEDDLFAEPARQEVDADEGLEPAAGPEAAALADQQPAVDEIEDIELDLSEFELDDFATDLPASEDTAPATLDEALSLDDFDFLGEADEGETQLGLAQAYLDMGDQGSAREILQEVIESGSDAHRERARALLDGLS